MTLPLHDIIFRTRALAQAHPFTPRAQAYLAHIAVRERAEQPTPQIGDWAVFALTVGYCLRRVEESDADGMFDPPDGLPGELDGAASDIAERIRSERAEGLLLYEEPLVIQALDHLIGGEVERRLADLADRMDKQTFEQLEEYIASWVIKGYSLRIAEQTIGEDQREEVSRP